MLSSSPPIVCVPFELGRPETVGPVTEKFGFFPIQFGPLLGFEFEKVTAESSPEWGKKNLCVVPLCSRVVQVVRSHLFWLYACVER